MEGTYHVYFGKQDSGFVQVKRCGLYYQFHCRCRLSGDIVCRLMVNCQGRQEKLGILVPMDGGFGVDTKLPVKRLPQGEPHFLLVPKADETPSQFAAIYPEEPFSYIDQLKEAFLVRKYGKLGIIVK